MKTSKAIFKLEFTLLSRKKNAILFLCLFVLSLYFVHYGIGTHRTVVKNKAKFQYYEQEKIKKYQHYGQYGTYGMWILFDPSPLSILFINSSTITELTADVDSGERLKLYNSFKGRTLFNEKAGGFNDFSGIMLLLGTLFALYLGYEAFIHSDYLRFAAAFSSHKKLFISIFLTRMLGIILFPIIIMGFSVLLLRLEGIHINSNEFIHLAIFLLVQILVLIFFFTLGTIAGSFKSRFYGFSMLVITWFVLVFLLPMTINSITYRKSVNIEAEYHLEQLKFEILMGVEKKIISKTGLPNEKNMAIIGKLVVEYLEKEFKQLESFEIELENEMKKNIYLYQSLAMLFPSTFYLSSGNEISSKGYENFIDFYSYIRELKPKFVHFIMMKRYFTSPAQLAGEKKRIQVESFIKNDENIFKSGSHLPSFFLYGIFATVFYILGLIMVSYRRFKESLKLENSFK